MATGRASGTGEYALADQTYAELVRRLAKDHFARTSPELARDLLAHFRDREKALADEGSDRDRRKTLAALTELEGRTGESQW